MDKDILIGPILDEEISLTMGELTRACSVRTEWIVELVEEGILEPSGRDNSHWIFSGLSLRRALIVRRLQRDLGANIAGAALALELMDEIEGLRTRLRVLENDGR